MSIVTITAQADDNKDAIAAIKKKILNLTQAEMLAVKTMPDIGQHFIRIHKPNDTVPKDLIMNITSFKGVAPGSLRANWVIEVFVPTTLISHPELYIDY